MSIKASSIKAKHTEATSEFHMECFCFNWSFCQWIEPAYCFYISIIAPSELKKKDNEIKKLRSQLSKLEEEKLLLATTTINSSEVNNSFKESPEVNNFAKKNSRGASWDQSAGKSIRRREGTIDFDEMEYFKEIIDKKHITEVRMTLIFFEKLYIHL